jgi:hypothetical protein
MLRRLFVSVLVCLPLLTLSAKIASPQASAEGRMPMVCALDERHPAAPDSQSLLCDHCSLCPSGVDEPAFIAAIGQLSRRSATSRNLRFARFDRDIFASVARCSHRARAPPV